MGGTTDISGATAEGSPRPEVEQQVRRLTSRVVMLALDPTTTVPEAALDLVRRAGGDLDVLLATVEQVACYCRARPGPTADKALAAVRLAADKAAALQRHPTGGVIGPILLIS